MNPLLLLADAGTQNLSIFDPASPPAESIRNLSVLVLAITGFIFVAVEGILIYSIVRFRAVSRSGDRATTGVSRAEDRAPTGPPAASTAEPPQVYGSKPIEIAWTAAPALVVLVIVLVTTRTLWEGNVTPPPEAPGD